MKVINHGNSKDNSNRLDSNDKSECFVEIEIYNLRKIFNYNSCFVFFEEVFDILFDFEYLFERNCSFIER